MATLYEIDEKYRAIVAAIEAAEGELTPEMETTLDIADDEFAAKAEAYCVIIREHEADCAAYSDEIDRLHARQKSAASTIDRLKKRLRIAVEIRGGKAEAGTFALSLRKSESVEIDDAAAVPADLCRVIPERAEPDKAAIKAALKSGRFVDGASIKESRNLQIK